MTSVPPRNGREVFRRHRRGEQRPCGGLIGRRTTDEAGGGVEIHFDLAERREQAVAGRLAHRFLACPVLEKAPAARLRIAVGDRGAFGRRQELACEAIGSDRARGALHIDADAHIASVSAQDADQGNAAGVRDVEVEIGVDAAQLGASALPSRNRNLAGRHVEHEPENATQRRAARDPAPAQRIGAKARGASLLGGRQHRGPALDFSGRGIEPAPPERNAVRDAREFARLASRVVVSRAH